MKHLKILLIITLLLKANFCQSQMNLKTLKNFELGATFSETKDSIRNIFKKNRISIKKTDFLGVYQIECEETYFENFGKCKYLFQYIKDSLAFIQISFEFKAGDTSKYNALLTELYNVLESSKDLKLVNESPLLNIKDAYKYVRQNSKETLKENAKGYIPINTKYLGIRFYDVYDNEKVTQSYLSLTTGISEVHQFSFGMNGETYYDGSNAYINLRLKSFDYHHLESKIKNVSLTYSTYTD